MALNPAKWALKFVQYRFLLLAIFFGMTLFLGYKATRITFNFSPDNIYLASDPAHHFYVNHFVKEFGRSANVCLIAIDGDLRDENIQQALVRLHGLIEKIPEIESVRSLVNTSFARNIHGVMQQMDAFEGGKVSLGNIEYIAQDPAMKNLLLSEKGNIPTIAARLPLHLGDQSLGDKITKDLKKAIGLVEAENPGLQIHLAGNPVLQYETISTLQRDQLLFLPLTILLMGFLLWLSFHTLRGVILPFIATSFAAFWAMGWLVLRGHSLDIINNKLAVLLLVIGISSAVQIYARFQDELRTAFDRAKHNASILNQDEIVARTVQALAIPCLLTTVIAALGFFAVAVSSVTIIRNFGIDASVGIMGSYLSTMLFVPAMLRILPLDVKHLKPASERKIHFIDDMLKRVSTISMNHPRLVMGVALLIASVSGFFAQGVEAKQKFASELPKNAPGIRALAFLEENVTGVMPFEIVFEGDSKRLKQADIVRLGAQLEEFMLKQSLVSSTRSFADILLSIDRSLTGEMPKSVTTWNDAKIDQVTQLFEMGDEALVSEASGEFYSKDGRYYRVQGLLNDISTAEVGKFRDLMAKETEKIAIDGVKIHFTGATIVSANALDHIIFTTIASIVVAIVAIFLLILILLRSLKFALIALFPNLLPILVTLAAMNIFDVSLRVATVLIFSMALGIAVDACVYLITRFSQEAASQELTNGQEKKALRSVIERTMRGSGRPVVYTTLMLLAGFSALSLSSFIALRDFAILSSVTLGTALIVDLFLWPALVYLINPKIGVKESSLLSH